MRLIDANALIEHLTRCIEQSKGLMRSVCVAIKCFVEQMPTVEVVHGRWVSDEADVLFHCSECETQISTSWDYDDLHWNYCPNCGAKMDGKDDEC